MKMKLEIKSKYVWLFVGVIIVFFGILLTDALIQANTKHGELEREKAEMISSTNGTIAYGTKYDSKTGKVTKKLYSIYVVDSGKREFYEIDYKQLKNGDYISPKESKKLAFTVTSLNAKDTGRQADHLKKIQSYTYGNLLNAEVRTGNKKQKATIHQQPKSLSESIYIHESGDQNTFGYEKGLTTIDLNYKTDDELSVDSYSSKEMDNIYELTTSVLKMIKDPNY